MKNFLLAFLACAVSVSSAQDLFADFQRSGSRYGATPTFSGFIPFFECGFVENSTQVLLEWQIKPYLKQDGSDYSKAFGLRDASFTSAIWWNFGGSELLANGIAILPGKVSLHSVDQIPAVQISPGIRAPTGNLTITTSAAPIGGATTPGRIVLMTFRNGVWNVEYDLALSTPRTDTRTIANSSDLTVRLLLIRTGPARAVAAVNMHVKVN